jgi:hypothetical protein
MKCSLVKIDPNLKFLLNFLTIFRITEKILKEIKGTYAAVIEEMFKLSDTKNSDEVMKGLHKRYMSWRLIWFRK